MSKFNTPNARARQTTVLSASSKPDGVNHYGSAAFSYDTKSELFLLGVTNMVNQDTFYEGAHARDSRYEDLIQQVALTDADWLGRFLTWLRGPARMRSASLVGALIGAKTLLDAGIPGAAPMVAGVLDRADEPAEAVAYWMSQYGRAIPKPIKRGIATAAGRLYTQFNTLKYDSGNKAIRFADVIQLCHVRPGDQEQSDLFRWLVNNRVTGTVGAVPLSLDMIRQNMAVRKGLRSGEVSLASPQAADTLRKAGMNWQDTMSASGETGGDKKATWEAQIPTMGYMALLRNLRNFDQAGVDDEYAEMVCDRLSNPEQVKRSRQLPLRFYAAYNQVSSDRWSWALSKALDVAVSNIPAMTGRTLVLVDTSPSMYGYGYGHGNRYGAGGMERWQLAALFGAATALRAHQADLFKFGGDVRRVNFTRGDSVLKTIGNFRQINYTDIVKAVVDTYDKHDRVLIFTDEQTQTGWTTQISAQSLWHARKQGPITYDVRGRAVAADVPVPVDDVVPAHVPIYTWNLGGYKFGHLPDKPNRYTFGGLSEAAFDMVDLLEKGHNADWPF